MTILIQINPKAKFNYLEDRLEIFHTCSTRKLVIDNSRPSLCALIKSLKEEQLSSLDHIQSVLDKYPEESILSSYMFISKIEKSGLIIYICQTSKSTLLELEPQKNNYQRSKRVKDDDLLSLNKNFILTYSEVQTSFVIDIPFADSFIRISDLALLNIIYQFKKNSFVSDIVKKLINIPEEDLLDALTLLVNACVLIKDTNQDSFTKNGKLINLWDFQDLNFHYRTRNGFHLKPLGATWRGKSLDIKINDFSTDFLSENIYLPKPSKNISQPGFFDVIESRKSIYNYGKEKLISIDQISKLLWYSYRIKYDKIQSDKNDIERTSRPVPGAGNIHELELYILVNKSQNIKEGFFHYNPRCHSLEIIKDGICDNSKILLKGCKDACNMKEIPHILIIIAAEYGKLACKYEGITYSLILKNAGVLIQQLYLVSTALGLSPSAIGCGNSALFSEITGLSVLKQPSVAEFILGP